MAKFKETYRIESARLPEHDYSKGGYYFVTICTHNRLNLFGKVENGIMILNDAGKEVENCIQEIPKHFLYSQIDYYCIMPNHIHLIIIIDKPASVETQNFVSLQNQFHKIIPFSLGSIVRGFKIGVTKWFRQNNGKDKIWQRNYYEHIIRNEKSLYEIRKYIQNNPLEWEDDEYYIQ